LGSKTNLSIALLATIALAVIAAGAKPDSALASRGMPRIAPDKTFTTFSNLRVQVLRMDLPWGQAIAKTMPKNGADPNDPAYDWDLYDQFVLNAKKHNMAVLFTIYGTPSWANGGQKPNRAPKKMSYLKNFAFAAAKRYSGTFERPDGTVLPAVRRWMAWNEPNNPVFLRPQWARVGKRNIPIAAKNYAAMCTAVWQGVHATHLKETVACGATDPKGNNKARSSRPSIAPLTFLSALHRYGLRRFDVYAHHPYYASPTESPAAPPKAKTTVTLGNINVLITLLTRLYGNKPLWITEYGYQTRPPDPHFGVSWTKQARYLTQAYAIARKNPRIGMMLWFLLRDESRLAGWQSGLMTVGGKHKPAYNAFRRLKH
jgi:Glycosyl hydrolase catalytic core